MALHKRTKAAAESLGFILVVAAILVAANFLGVFASGRIDLTRNKLFSLSNGSRNVAAQLTDRMTITAYFSENLPPPHNATEMYVRDMLREYEVASNGNIRVRFVNPDTDELREEATEAGLQKLQHPYAGNDTQQVTEGFRGLVFEYLEGKKTLDNVTTEGLEYDITQRIKELAGDKVKIGILSGHGGPTLAEGLGNLRRVAPTYELSEVSANQEIPRDLKALLIIGAETAITENELRYINQFVMRGGSLGIFGGTIKIEMQELNGSVIDTGLNRLLNAWGVRMEPNIVGDNMCQRVPLPGNGFPVPFPPIPIVSIDETQQDHPALFHLPQLTMPFPSPISRTGTAPGAGVRIQTLARSSVNSGLLSGEPVSLRPRPPQEGWPIRPTPEGPFALVVAIEGRLPSAFAAAGMSTATSDAPEASNIQAPDRAERAVQVLVSGASLMFRDEMHGDPERINPQMLPRLYAFQLNAIDWLAQDDDMVAIRAKSAEDPALRVPDNVMRAETDFRAAAEGQQAAAAEGNRAGVEAAGASAQAAIDQYKSAMAAWDAKKSLYRWGNMLGAPVVIALFGLIRWRMRKAKKANIKLA